MRVLKPLLPDTLERGASENQHAYMAQGSGDGYLRRLRQRSGLRYERAALWLITRNDPDSSGGFAASGAFYSAGHADRT